MGILGMLGLAVVVSSAVPSGIHDVLASDDNSVSRCTQFVGVVDSYGLRALCAVYSEWQVRHTDIYGHEPVGVTLVDAAGKSISLQITRHEEIRAYCNRYGTCSAGYLKIEATGGGFTARFEIPDEFRATPPYAISISGPAS